MGIHEQLLQAASDPERTPFDYIVVGSGAGGGPLAARLAEAGKRVLLIEAGTDPARAQEDAPGPVPPEGGAPRPVDRAVYRVPALNGAATEDPRCNWSFSVRHYDSLTLQQADRKYRSEHDPAQPLPGAPAETGSGGILYPRSSALGGCTAHHAMIIVKPNDSDWNRIAALTGDPSWRAEVMQGYFTRIETCLYYEDYNGFLKGLVRAYRLLMRAASFIHPRWQLDRGGHGRSGWQKTSFISPLLIRRIASGDRGFLRLLLKAFWFLVREPGRLRALLRATLRGQLVQLLDPNFGSMRGGASGQAALIPVGTDGRQRVGLRERLLQVAAAAPDRLVLLGGTLVTRVLFRSGEAAPRAQGVETVAGLRLYQVGRASAAVPPHAPARACYAREEVILCGGAFNTPQLLMLSGVGEAQHLAALGIQGPRDAAGRVVAPVVNLPGVGRNLQDRYEVAVISHARTPFSTLDGVAFDPEDPADPAMLQWRQSGSGLYTTNGGAVAFFLQSGHTPSRDQPGTVCADPDLFVFGVPVAFRGYYWGWSKQLLHDAMDAPAARRDLWTWVLLKAYTDNNAGTVRLRSASAFHQPQITFHSFSEGPPGHAGDTDALAWGVAFVRRLNEQLPLQQEVQPGAAVQTDSQALRQWIRDEAWGHHACGTCRIGSDPWKADVRELKDHGAVLDGQLRVHGVEGLRVCDASVFHRIPGYFIVTPVFMVSEKAADMLLAQSAAYPARLEAHEARAIRARRRIVQHGQQPTLTESALDADNQLPPCTVGLALSGGGIRSATFALGLLQTLARRGRLRQIDLLSTVSGGGYVGAFLGRLFTRVAGSVANPAERVERTLGDTGSDELYWLRRHASYLLSAGRSDLQTHLGVMWRNLVTVHVVVGALLLALFTSLRWLGGASPAGSCASGWVGALTCSPWWWLPAVLLGVAVIPMVTAYWLAPKPIDPPVTPWFSLLVWLVLIGGALYALQWPDAQPVAGAALAMLLLGWIWQELVRHRRPPDTPAAEVGVIVRNRLSRGLGISLLMTGAAIGWVLLDSLARTVTDTMRLPVVGGMVLVNLLLPLARVAWERARSLHRRVADAVPSAAGSLGIGLVAFTLATFLLFALDVLAHAAFAQADQVGLYVCVVALLLSWAIGRSTRFVNLSSLQAAYATRLARTFLGASNPARVHAGAGGVPPDVSEAHPQDDLPFTGYHPERHGGPLHLVNVCVNETADVVTGRHLPEDKGLAMCLGPAGISVGVRYHTLWNPVPADDAPDAAHQRPAVIALPLGANPESFHVLGRDDGRPAAVEGLTLSQWMAISGAAFTTGAGRMTRLVVSLLYGLLNIRLGYWWNSGVDAADRPGRFPPTLWNRLLSAPGALFRTQRLLLDEWRGWFPGPAVRYWYLSDGTHFENTGLYELVRRRTAFMIAVDGSEDPHYQCEEMAVLARRVRLDFGARIEWLDPVAGSRSGDAWRALPQGDEVPAWIRDWLDPACLGALSRITRDGEACAALARVHHADGSSSWLLLVKPCLGPFRESLDLRSYAARHADFPHQPTYDQFFDDQQWESYRLLGELTGGRVFR